MSRRVLLSAVSAVLLPVVVIFLAVPATGAPPKKRFPAPPKTAPSAPPKAAAKPLVGGERAILKALKEPTSLEFVETPLQDVIDYLQQKHGIPIVFDKKELEGLNIDPSPTMVTKNLKGISLRSALKIMLDELGLKYVIHNEVLLITSPTRAESEEFLITKVYDVSDLVIPLQDHPYHATLPGAWRLEVPSTAGPTRNRPDYDSLIDLIGQCVAPNSWPAGTGPPGGIAAYDLSLVISQSREVHDEIEALLARIRAARRRAVPTVVVEFQWLWLESAVYQQLVGARAPAPARVPLAIDAKALDGIAHKAAGFRGRIVCTNGQLVHLASGDRRSVITSTSPTVEVKAAGTQGGALAMPNSAYAAPAGVWGSMGSGFFSVGDSMGPMGPIGPMSPPTPKAPAAPSVPAAPPTVNVQTAQSPIPAIVTQTAYQPVIDVPNVGVVVEVRPSVAPGANTAVLDLRSTVTRWLKPSPPAKLGGPGSASCPVDRPNMPAAEMAMTARVPLGKPVLLGAVTFAPAGGAGLDRATDNPVQLCLIATTSIAEDAEKPARKK
ncbi:MAG: DUF4974 domain-containing protein [Thermoguttaceae bacterium]|jgi:hypothetical protein